MTTRTRTKTPSIAEPGSAAAIPFLAPPDRDSIAAQLRALRGQRVAVAMSGGVDSSVAAHALVAAGAEVVGLALRLHDAEPDNPLAPRACCAPDDLQDARRVAEALDIPFYVIDARAAFEEGVVTPFVRDYVGGRTPNPCVGCNSFVKLGLLHRRARSLGAVRLATGHYARSSTDAAGRAHLFRAVDQAKDQSYFLFGTGGVALSELLFPLGAMTKAEVRAEALSSGLPVVAHKLDSQEVCFVGGAGAAGYVKRRPEAAGTGGVIVDASGTELGTHDGVAGFTIGQRRGLGLGIHRRLFVLSIDGDSHTVTVGDEDALKKSALVASGAVWPSGAPQGAFVAEAKIRYRDRGAPVIAEALEDGTLVVQFERPVRAIAPGQAVVLYNGDEVLGGAWIQEALG